MDWSIEDCEDCYYLKDGKCWYKNYPIDIPKDMCTEAKIQGEDEE